MSLWRRSYQEEEKEEEDEEGRIREGGRRTEKRRLFSIGAKRTHSLLYSGNESEKGSWGGLEKDAYTASSGTTGVPWPKLLEEERVMSAYMSLYRSPWRGVGTRIWSKTWKEELTQEPRRAASWLAHMTIWLARPAFWTTQDHVSRQGTTHTGGLDIPI